MPNRSDKEIQLLRPLGRSTSTGSGVIVGKCYVATDMHVLYSPYDELSFGRELERKVNVLASVNGEQFIVGGKAVMFTESYWKIKDKKAAREAASTGTQYWRKNEDVALIKLDPFVVKKDKTYRTVNLGDLTGSYKIADKAPDKTEFMNLGAETGLYTALGTLYASLARPLRLLWDKECWARPIDKYGFITFKGNCHVVNGMSGGALIGKKDLKLYALIYAGDLDSHGAPSKEVPASYSDDDVLWNVPLNHFMALWPHYDRIVKAIRENPCQN